MIRRGSSDPQGHSWVSALALTLLVFLYEGQGQEIMSDGVQSVCTVKGRVFTNRDWYGYVVHKAFKREYAKIQYQITYPVRECCASLLIYYDDQAKQLSPSMTCEERLAVLPPDNNQVIPLRANNDTTSGCSLWNETGSEAFYICLGERVFRSSIPRTWFFAVSRCGSDRNDGPLNLNYVFNITGYYGECEEDPLSPSAGWSAFVHSLGGEEDSTSMKDVYRYLSISLGVVAGIALILASVFFGLWFIGLRAAGKGKGGSVTSSQATMTQDDIFYVNPSLSDREHPDYSQTNSGSENYYEVIPERRSYESINAGLSSTSGTLLSANGGLHLRHIRSGGASLNHPHLHHPVHLGSLHHAQHHLHNGHLSLNQHRPHPLVGGGASIPLGHAPQPQLNGVIPGGHSKPNGLPYVFEDYPPPPYQPPKVIGIKNSTSGSGMPLIAPSPAQNNVMSTVNGHAHTLSLPTSQRQRPTLCHHAYHSSLVPTSEALGNLGNAGNAMSNSMILNNNTSGNNIVISSSGMLINSTAPGGGVDGTPSSFAPPSNNGVGGAPGSLGTFGMGANSINSTLIPSGGGINMTSLANHHLMGGASHAGPSSSGASSTPLASLAAALSLNSASSNSHVPAPAPSGQSETSA
ncbi:transmembrane protein 145 [Elysia marginata]|uniref:Transmembrane protein 145 n=1 Tax=Elysia marginata TaxID=1093978 RepID=A0AAV4H8L8_9GAST|nr:transmembrane protein 145 [Elysia marginata]